MRMRLLTRNGLKLDLRLRLRSTSTVFSLLLYYGKYTHITTQSVCGIEGLIWNWLAVKGERYFGIAAGTRRR